MKKILFLTGTRADFGKLKPLINIVRDSEDFDFVIFGTGMHMLSKYGTTINELKNSGYTPYLFTFINQMEGDPMEVVLSKTISGLSSYINENQVDMIVIHGDRIETLAGAITGALRNILVAHIEGGEVSGTIDDLIRHSTSKLSHLHFIANDNAKQRLLQLGELESSIFNIGSPDIDIMYSKDLPTLEMAIERYELPFDEFAIAILHPVTTETDKQYEHAKTFVKALKDSGQNYIVVQPNNDMGAEHIFRSFDEELKDIPNIKIFPSIRFEYFLSLLKHAQFLIGNSSSGIHEAPAYGVPTINIGSRQLNRFHYESIINVPFDVEKILEAIKVVLEVKSYPKTNFYGDGTSAQQFIDTLRMNAVWDTPKQKVFQDLFVKHPAST